MLACLHFALALCPSLTVPRFPLSHAHPALTNRRQSSDGASVYLAKFSHSVVKGMFDMGLRREEPSTRGDLITIVRVLATPAAVRATQAQDGSSYEEDDKEEDEEGEQEEGGSSDGSWAGAVRGRGTQAPSRFHRDSSHPRSMPVQSSRGRGTSGRGSSRWKQAAPMTAGSHTLPVVDRGL
jgi:hypothetical protein